VCVSGILKTSELFILAECLGMGASLELQLIPRKPPLAHRLEALTTFIPS